MSCLWLCVSMWARRSKCRDKWSAVLGKLASIPAPPLSHVEACITVSEQMLGQSILHHFSVFYFSLHSPPSVFFSLPQHNPVKQVLSSQTCHLGFRLKHNCNFPHAHLCGCCCRLEGDDLALESLFHAEKNAWRTNSANFSSQDCLRPLWSQQGLLDTPTLTHTTLCN